MIGVVLMIAMRGTVQLLHEHAMMVDAFDANRELVLRSFGWEPDSIQADLYERRLRQPEATGWFGLANIFSAFMAIGLVLLVTVIFRVREGISSGSRAGFILLAAGFAILLLFNGSKGAIGASCIGLVIGFLWLLFPRLRTSESLRPLVGVLALCSLGFIFMAIFVRGAILGEVSLGGELSLLFRWHYMLGALKMFFAHPLYGVGPAGFQDAYLLYKNAWSAEDPTSAHNAIIDWVATLGIFGLAWCVLLGLLAFRSSLSECTGDRPSMGAILFSCALALAGLAGIWFEFETLIGPMLVLRFGSILLAIAVMLGASRMFDALPRPAVPWCLGGAAATILVLGSLDMLFTQTGSVVAAWAFLGAISVARARATRVTDVPVAIVPAVIGAWCLFFCAVPLLRVDAMVEDAAAPLRSLARLHRAFGEPPPGIQPTSREQAVLAVRAEGGPLFEVHGFDDPDWAQLAPGSNDPRIIADALVRRLAPEARRAAISRLVATWDLYPRNLRPAWISVDQLRLLAGEGDPDAASTALLEALSRTESLAERSPGPRGAITTAWILDEFERLQGEPDLESVVSTYRHAIDWSPHDPALWIGLAGAARDMGDRELEAEALAGALLADERRHLDPLVQLPEAERAILEERLDGLQVHPSE